MSERALPDSIDTAVIGAGQAGLVMSWHLTQSGREHVVLERYERLGGSWPERWDAFRLVTPNWTTSLPGYPYDGPDPDGFMHRDEIADRTARYAGVFGAPVVLRAGVRRLAIAKGGGFDLETDRGRLRAGRVVVATGGFHVPRIPKLASALPGRLTQLHTGAYRNERALPDGAVLIVGTGQSGVQIAQELMDAGRTVYLAVGSAPRWPRRYRGQDVFRWLYSIARDGASYGVSLPTVDDLPDPRLRFAGNPALTGHGDGRQEVDLRRMAAFGINLLGHLEAVVGERIFLRADLSQNLHAADRFFDERMRPLIDRFIDAAGLDAPPDDRVPFRFEPREVATLELDAAGITTVIWATGFRLDFGWLEPPILDESGYPRQRRGVTEVPGLYFLGLPWMHTQGSVAIFGVQADAAYLAGQMGLAGAPAGTEAPAGALPGSPRAAAPATAG